MQLSPSDLQLIRTQPQESRLFLSFYQPETVFAAQVANAPTDEGHRIIVYDNVSLGAQAAVLPNFAMMVGTTAGRNDLGVIRVRNNLTTGSVTSAFVVAENSHIAWVSGAYITVLNYVDVEAIYPRIVFNPNDITNNIFFKDFDIVYDNQNTIQGSFVCMGPHRAAYRDPASGLAQLYWSASGTYNVNGDALTYAWEFEGATVTGSTSATPGYRTYDHAGHFRTRLVVTSSEGAIDFGYRFVSIYDQPDVGPSRPIVEWEISELNGDRSRGGYTGRVKIWERIGPEFVKDGQLVVIFSDDFYGTTRKNLGGNAENCSDIFWVGYVMKGTIQYNYKEGTVEFELGSISEMMKQAQGFSISCQDDPAPNTWYKILNLSIQKALFHYLRWHTTAFNLADFQYTGDDRKVQYLDTNRESMYDAIAMFLANGIKGELVTDRQGKLWAEISALATHNARTALPVCMPIGPNDYGGSPQIRERYFPEVSYVEYGGIIYDPLATPTSTAVLSAAPGITPNYKGSIDHMEGMILNSQTQLDEITGDSLAYQNSRFPEIVLPLMGGYKNLDIAPLESVLLTISPDLTPRHIE